MPVRMVAADNFMLAAVEAAEAWCWLRAYWNIWSANGIDIDGEPFADFYLRALWPCHERLDKALRAYVEACGGI